MYLYLMQHGEALPKEEDPERPLSPEGSENVKRLAGFLSAYKGFNVEHIFHSGKKRAEQTAKMIGNRISPSLNTEKANDMEPKDDPENWLKRLDKLESNIMLTGHLPHLSKLAAALLTGNKENEIIQFRYASVVCLVRNDQRTWFIKWMILPGML